MALNIPTLQELLEAGVHFGHQVRRGNPRMKPFIYTAREGVHIIDLTKSEEYLKKACEYVFELGKNGKVLLFVGTKKQARPIVEEYAKKVGASYLANKWNGGFLTNFDEIQKNIKKLRTLKEQKEKGELVKYTKKEQLLIDRKIAKLDQNFRGVVSLLAVPDAVYIVDTVSEQTANKEAKMMGIAVVAIADSNSNPALIDYPIPGNDDAIKSIKILTEAVANAYEAGQKQRSKDVDAAKKKQDELDAKINTEVVGIAPKEVAAVEELLEKKAVKEFERKVI